MELGFNSETEREDQGHDGRGWRQRAGIDVKVQSDFYKQTAVRQGQTTDRRNRAVEIGTVQTEG